MAKTPSLSELRRAAEKTVCFTLALPSVLSVHGVLGFRGRPEISDADRDLAVLTDRRHLCPPLQKISSRYIIVLPSHVSPGLAQATTVTRLIMAD